MDTTDGNISSVTRIIADNERVVDKIQNPVKVHGERPRPRRYPFAATAELFDLQSEVQIHCLVIDLSFFGCGVTASKRLAVGTKLRIRMTHKGSTFSAGGKVTYATSEGHMGIVFTRTEPNDQLILEKWISELRDHSGTS